MTLIWVVPCSLKKSSIKNSLNLAIIWHWNIICIFHGSSKWSTTRIHKTCTIFSYLCDSSYKGILIVLLKMIYIFTLQGVWVTELFVLGCSKRTWLAAVGIGTPYLYDRCWGHTSTSNTQILSSFSSTNSALTWAHLASPSPHLPPSAVAISLCLSDT